MKRFLSGLILVTIFLFIGKKPVLAINDFDANFEIIYELKINSLIQVTQKVSLTNKKPDIYPSEYTLETGNLKIENLKAFDDEGEIIPQIIQQKNNTQIKLKFNHQSVGEGKILNFQISYQLLETMIKNGQVWELNLPRLPKIDNLKNGSLTIISPDALGKLAYISPNIYKIKTVPGYTNFIFDKDNLGETQVSAIFGQFQIFSFSLKYHLINQYPTVRKTTIALPPDNSFQRIYLESINPLPVDVNLDEDGNWLAEYLLSPSQKTEILVSGVVKIFSQPWGYPLKPESKTLINNSSADKFWESQNSEIINKSKDLKTAQNIYNYVVSGLTYNLDRSKEKTDRKGAVRALKEPNDSICMEFTDLFIALCRASNIPAREINGYAYTANERLRPISQYTDILHSWPEYWDQNQGIWMPVDPTWGKTTLGRNYFSEFDLNHFVFVIHGQDSEMPLPAGSYKIKDEINKDVQVNFSDKLPKNDQSLNVEFQLNDFAGKKRKIPLIIITNPGPAARYQFDLIFESENIDFEKYFKINQKIEVLLPFGKKEIPINFKTPNIFQLGKAILSLKINDERYDFPFRSEKLILFSIIILLILIILLLISAVILIHYFKIRILKIKK